MKAMLRLVLWVARNVQMLRQVLGGAGTFASPHGAQSLDDAEADHWCGRAVASFCTIMAAELRPRPAP